MLLKCVNIINWEKSFLVPHFSARSYPYVSQNCKKKKKLQLEIFN